MAVTATGVVLRREDSNPKLRRDLDQLLGIYQGEIQQNRLAWSLSQDDSACHPRKGFHHDQLAPLQNRLPVSPQIHDL